MQSRNGDTDVENKHAYQSGEGGGDWETGAETYIFLRVCREERTSEDLLYSTGNSTRRSVVIEMGKKSKKEGIYDTYG